MSSLDTRAVTSRRPLFALLGLFTVLALLLGSWAPSATAGQRSQDDTGETTVQLEFILFQDHPQGSGGYQGPEYEFDYPASVLDHEWEFTYSVNGETVMGDDGQPVTIRTRLTPDVPVYVTIGGVSLGDEIRVTPLPGTMPELPEQFRFLDVFNNGWGRVTEGETIKYSLALAVARYQFMISKNWEGVEPEDWWQVDVEWNFRDGSSHTSNILARGTLNLNKDNNWSTVVSLGEDGKPLVFDIEDRPYLTLEETSRPVLPNDLAWVDPVWDMYSHSEFGTIYDRPELTSNGRSITSKFDCPYSDPYYGEGPTPRAGGDHGSAWCWLAYEVTNSVTEGEEFMPEKVVQYNSFYDDEYPWSGPVPAITLDNDYEFTYEINGILVLGPDGKPVTFTVNPSRSFDGSVSLGGVRKGLDGVTFREVGDSRPQLPKQCEWFTDQSYSRVSGDAPYILPIANLISCAHYQFTIEKDWVDLEPEPGWSVDIDWVLHSKEDDTTSASSVLDRGTVTLSEENGWQQLVTQADFANHADRPFDIMTNPYLTLSEVGKPVAPEGTEWELPTWSYQAYTPDASGDPKLGTWTPTEVTSETVTSPFDCIEWRDRDKDRLRGGASHGTIGCLLAYKVTNTNSETDQSFGVEIASQVSDASVMSGDTLSDSVTVSLLPGDAWASEAGSPVELRVDGVLYGPFSAPQAQSGTVPAGSPVAYTTSQSITGPGVFSVSAPAGTASDPGYYAWVWSIDKDAQSEVARKYLRESVSDAFFAPSETVRVRAWFDFTLSSQVPEPQILLGEGFSDTVTLTLVGDSPWPTDDAGEPLPVVLTGVLYGPFDQMQDPSPVVPSDAVAVGETKVTFTEPGTQQVDLPGVTATGTGYYAWVWSALRSEQGAETASYMAGDVSDDFFASTEVVEVVPFEPVRPEWPLLGGNSQQMIVGIGISAASAALVAAGAWVVRRRMS